MKQEMHHNKDIFNHYMRQPREKLNKDGAITQRFASTGLDVLDNSNNQDELAQSLYPNIVDEKKEFEREKKITTEIKKAKFNYT